MCVHFRVCYLHKSSRAERPAVATVSEATPVIVSALFCQGAIALQERLWEPWNFPGWLVPWCRWFRFSQSVNLRRCPSVISYYLESLSEFLDREYSWLATASEEHTQSHGRGPSPLKQPGWHVAPPWQPYPLPSELWESVKASISRVVVGYSTAWLVRNNPRRSHTESVLPVAGARRGLRRKFW